MAKKGMELPMNIIAIAIIVILVLTLVILFATGMLTKLFKGTQQVSEAATPEELTAFKVGCQQACFTAQQLVKSEDEWKDSEYCTKYIMNGSSKLYCYNVTTCTKTISTGELGPSNCKLV